MKRPEWNVELKKYAQPDVKKSMVQLFTAIIPYLTLLTVMYLIMSNGYSYWIVLLLSILAGGFLVRIFIIFHDCAHQSFFNSKPACEVVGNICGILTFTAFADWRRAHATHHASVANLEKRGVGDVWTMTVDEYLSSTKLRRFYYRAYRNPLFHFFIGPLFLFLVVNRFPGKYSKKKEFISIIFTNLMILSIVITASFVIGIKNYIAIQLPTVFVAGSIGVWFFYIQHQFANVYWAHNENWDPFKAAMEGSSYYKIPEVLNWFSGHIGYHHLHHLNPRIPNYNLKKCYDNIPELHEVVPITLFKGFKSIFLQLYDENQKKLISFSKLKKQTGNHLQKK